MKPSSAKPTVVLVHGAWADASSWRKVIPVLFQEELSVVGVQNPTSSLADDVVATKLALKSHRGSRRPRGAQLGWRGDH